jgi:hypothetical protein
MDEIRADRATELGISVEELERRINAGERLEQ